MPSDSGRVQCQVGGGSGREAVVVSGGSGSAGGQCPGDSARVVVAVPGCSGRAGWAVAVPVWQRHVTVSRAGAVPTSDVRFLFRPLPRTLPGQRSSAQLPPAPAAEQGRFAFPSYICRHSVAAALAELAGSRGPEGSTGLWPQQTHPAGKAALAEGQTLPRVISSQVTNQTLLMLWLYFLPWPSA